MKHLLTALAYVILIVLCAWLFMSWIDIVIDNTMPNPIHSPYNFFIIFARFLEAIK